MTQKLQLVQNVAPHTLTGINRSHYVTPILQVVFHAQFKVLVIIHKALYHIQTEIWRVHLTLQTSA